MILNLRLNINELHDTDFIAVISCDSAGYVTTFVYKRMFLIIQRIRLYNLENKQYNNVELLLQIWNNHHIFMCKYPFEKNIDFYKIYILRMSIWKKLTILSYNITLYLLLFHVTFIQNIFSTNINLFYYYYLEDSSSISDIWYTVSQKHLNYFIGNLINLILIKIYIYI